jgi:hypothetical protein
MLIDVGRFLEEGRGITVCMGQDKDLSRFCGAATSYAMEAIVAKEENLGRGVDATPVASAP